MNTSPFFEPFLGHIIAGFQRFSPGKTLIRPRTMLIMDIVTSTQDAITQSSESLRLRQNRLRDLGEGKVKELTITTTGGFPSNDEFKVIELISFFCPRRLTEVDFCPFILRFQSVVYFQGYVQLVSITG